MREIVPSHGAAVRNKRATQWWGEFSANPTGLPPHCCCLASSAFLQSSPQAPGAQHSRAAGQTSGPSAESSETGGSGREGLRQTQHPLQVLTSLGTPRDLRPGHLSREGSGLAGGLRRSHPGEVDSLHIKMHTSQKLAMTVSKVGKYLQY